MKRLKQVCLAIIFLVCFAFTLPARAQGEVTYLGEICFSLHEINTTSVQGEVGILSFGPGHFALYGSFGSFALGGITIPVQGTAIITGTTVTITLNGSNADTTSLVVPTGIVDNLYMTLDIASPPFGGRFVEMVTFIPTPPGGPASVARNGDVVLRQCP
jgi:hypothetical protein